MTRKSDDINIDSIKQEVKTEIFVEDWNAHIGTGADSSKPDTDLHVDNSADSINCSSIFVSDAEGNVKDSSRCFTCITCNTDYTSMEELLNCSCRLLTEGKKWLPQLVRLFLTSLIGHADSFHSGNKRHVFKSIAEEMVTANSSFPFTPEELRKKYSNLLIRYRKLKDSNKDRHTWEFFNLMDELHMKGAELPPAHVLSGSTLFPQKSVLDNVSRSESSSPLQNNVNCGPVLEVFFPKGECPPIATRTSGMGKKRKLYDSDSYVESNKKKRIDETFIKQYIHNQTIFNKEIKAELTQMNKHLSKLSQIDTHLSELTTAVKEMASSVKQVIRIEKSKS